MSSRSGFTVTPKLWGPSLTQATYSKALSLTFNLPFCIIFKERLQTAESSGPLVPNLDPYLF